MSVSVRLLLIQSCERIELALKVLAFAPQIQQ
jgi:hypothetical protein